MISTKRKEVTTQVRCQYYVKKLNEAFSNWEKVSDLRKDRLVLYKRELMRRIENERKK